ncbi:MAG: T9SS type A sorting domain-containing protein [Bacteroidia bacterium]|nr:T9SS type A sorting domain-containing protein [Bacteroidia bacterium]
MNIIRLARKTALLLIAVWGTITVSAQSLTPEVLTSAGETFKGTNVSLDWTMGEIMTESFAGTTLVLTQGFQQPSLTSTSIEELASSFGTIKVYPNPTSNRLFIERERGQNLQVMLLDMKGSMVLQKTIQPLMGELNLSSYANGIYVLRMTDGKKFAQTIRIEKR